MAKGPSAKNDQKIDTKAHTGGSGEGFSQNRDPKPLVPEVFFYCLIFISLALPNLVFSGTGWFDTLHIMKWVFAMVPIALISLVGGARLFLFGPGRIPFKLDLFGLIWLLMLGYISAQPLWVDISSKSTYMKEWFFFATLAAAYIFTFNLFRDSGFHKVILWSANINAAINVVFAELLIRGLNGPFPFIMNVPGNYIGNTGQQEMFGLWMAMALMNGIYLHVAFGSEEGHGGRKFWMQSANLFLLAVNAWGLWNSTTRGGILSLLVGTAALGLIVLRTQDRSMLKRVAQILSVILIMFFVTLAAGKIAGIGRSSDLVSKISDMLENTSTFGNRTDIWRTSWAVFKSQPLQGVGIGQFKWHYLDGQRIVLQKYPKTKWQYTYWAHNEYIQWLAEFGIFGGLLLLLTGIWWIWNLAKAMIHRKKLSSEAVWACSMLFLIWFDAIFSRPFHRIEDALWLSFAFAMANRDILPLSYKWSEIRHSSVYRAVGFFIAATACAGIVFLWSGLCGDQYLKRAAMTNDAELQGYLIGKAKRFPMTRDDAEEQYAYHLLAIARATNRPEDLDRGIDQLYKSFTIRPKAKQLMELVSLAQQTGNQSLLRLLVPYLSPDRFQISPGGKSAP